MKSLKGIFLSTYRQNVASNICRNVCTGSQSNFACFQQENIKANDEQKLRHVFKTKLNREMVLEYLGSNIIYNKDGLLVVNKPYGVGKAEPQKEKPKFLSQRHLPQGDEVFVDNLLEDLAVMTGHTSLHIGRIPQRYSSGVMILTGDEEAKRKVERSVKLAKGRASYMENYLLVSQGRPSSTQGEVKLGLKLDVKDNLKLPILVTDWSVNDMKYNRITTSKIKHQVLCSGELASLTLVGVTSTKWNCLRLFMSTQLMSPILGDSIFSARVRSVLGVPLLVDHWSDVANTPQNIPQDILSALKLSPKDSSIVPLHIHLHKVVLPKYDKGEDLTVTAPVPMSFVWTCQQLELDHDLLY